MSCLLQKRGSHITYHSFPAFIFQTLRKHDEKKRARELLAEDNAPPGYYLLAGPGLEIPFLYISKLSIQS